MKLILEIREPAVVEFESVAELERWLERERDRLRREEFREYLNAASAIVSTWEPWEQNIFGNQRETRSRP